MSTDFSTLEMVEVYPYNKLPVTDRDRFHVVAEELANRKKVWMLAPLDDVTLEDFIAGEYSSFDSELELVEDWAVDNGLISDEDEASQAFEQHLRDTMDVKLLYKAKDTTDPDHWFSNWIDAETQAHRVHPSQNNEYEYVNDYDKFLDSL